MESHMSLDFPWCHSTYSRRRRWCGDQKFFSRKKFAAKNRRGQRRGGGEADDTTEQPSRAWDHTELPMRLDAVLDTHMVRKKVESHLSFDALRLTAPTRVCADGYR